MHVLHFRNAPSGLQWTVAVGRMQALSYYQFLPAQFLFHYPPLRRSVLRRENDKQSVLLWLSSAAVDYQSNAE